MKNLFKINPILIIFLMLELGNVSSPYDKNEISEMKLGKVIKKKEVTPENVKVLAAGIVVSDIDAIRKVIIDCEKHKEFIPRCKLCQILHFKIDSIYSKIVIDTPLIPDLTYYLETNLSYSDSVTLITWKMDTTKPPPYILDTYGFWKITSLDSTTYILACYMDIDLKFHWTLNWILKPIIKFMIKNDLPELIENFRARIESQEIWEIGQKKPIPKIVLKK
ncbi:MAG: hypothetical protein JSW07_13500 [bacterium]|nr:MAG: hypothetical protein JSW07_13500 [bacterium]